MKSNLAYIHPNAKLGDNVTVEPFAYIADDVQVGDGCWIGPNVTLMPGTRLGKKCRIFPGAVIGAIPQDLKFKGEYSTAVIGDNCTIRECVTINRGTFAKGTTIIKNNALLMAYVHVAHDCVIGNNVILVNAVQVAGEVEIDDHAIIGGTTAIHQFVRIGVHAMISGGSLVRKDVPPYVKAAREPLSYVGINSIGLRRRQFNSSLVRDIQDCYRYIYQSDMNNSQALEKIESAIPKSEVRDEIVNFVRASKRGIMKGYATVVAAEESE